MLEWWCWVYELLAFQGSRYLHSQHGCWDLFCCGVLDLKVGWKNEEWDGDLMDNTCPFLITDEPLSKAYKSHLLRWRCSVTLTTALRQKTQAAHSFQWDHYVCTAGVLKQRKCKVVWQNSWTWLNFFCNTMQHYPTALTNHEHDCMCDHCKGGKPGVCIHDFPEL